MSYVGCLLPLQDPPAAGPSWYWYHVEVSHVGTAVVSTAHLAADGCVEGSLGPSAGAGGQGCQSAHLLEHLSSLAGVWDAMGVGRCCR